MGNLEISEALEQFNLETEKHNKLEMLKTIEFKKLETFESYQNCENPNKQMNICEIWQSWKFKLYFFKQKRFKIMEGLKIFIFWRTLRFEKVEHVVFILNEKLETLKHLQILNENIAKQNIKQFQKSENSMKTHKLDQVWKRC